MISTVFSLRQGFDLIKQVDKHPGVHPAGLNIVTAGMVATNQPQAVRQLDAAAVAEWRICKALKQPLRLEQPQTGCCAHRDRGQ